MGLGDDLAGFAVERDFKRAFDQTDVADQVVLVNPLNLRRLGFQLQPVLHREEVRADEGDTALDVAFAQAISQAGDGIIKTAEAVGRDLVVARFGLVGNQFGHLTRLQNDGAEGTCVPQIGVGLLA